MIDPALEYVEAGWAVLPIWPIRAGICACGRNCGRTGGKHPINVLAPQGVKNATKDPAVVRQWWSRYPDANVAVATGEVSEIFVLDVDVRHGGFESLDVLERQNGQFPLTRRAVTASGGMHVYFQWPGQNVRNTVAQLGSGLDIRGDGGYVVAPPSQLPTGGYSWTDPRAPVLEAPPWFRALVVGGSVLPVDPLEVAELLNGVPEGQRDIILFRWACKLRAIGLPRELAEELVVHGARKCEPPFEEDIAREKVRRVYQQYRKEHHFTDVGNADRLVDRHGDDVRYCRAGYWLVWDGVRWNQNNGHLVVPLAEETVQSLIAEAAELVGNSSEVQDKKEQLITHAMRSERRERIVAMVDLAKYEPRVSVFTEDLDKDVMLLNTSNGIVDLRTGVLRPHRREDFLTKITGAPYYQGAEAPTWEAFLERVIPDETTRAFVHRAVGYSITGSTQEQCMFFLYGVGANGKSTFLRAIQTALGDYAKQATPDLMMMDKADSHPTALADLVGARFVPTIEIEEGKRLAEAQVKWMTGSDVLKARYMRQDYFEYLPQFKLWLASNHRPMIYGRDNAIWRRILMVPFTVVIPPGERDEALPEKLTAEMPGIMAWAVRGCEAWRTQGLNPPASVMAAVDKYKTDMDVLGSFMDECVKEDRESRLLATDLYAAFSGWCKASGEFVLTQRRFSNQLGDMGHVRERGTAHKYVWLGLTLTPGGRDFMALGLGAKPVDLMPFVAQEAGA